LLEDEASHDMGTPNSVTWFIVNLRCLECTLSFQI
jgi:hypothetical protein